MRRFFTSISLTLSCATPLGALAQSDTADLLQTKVTDQPFTWVLGVAVNNSANYQGSNQRSTGAKPMLGLNYGRYTLSTGGGGALLNFDLVRKESAGFSARLIDSEQLRLSAGLSLGGGRSSGDDPMLQGLPEVRRSVRGRLTLLYSLSHDISLRSVWSTDLLGRGGGSTWENNLNYGLRLGERSMLSMGVGVTLADATFMRSYLGVPASAAGVSTALPAYRPGAGLHSLHAGLELKTALTRHWLAVAGLGYSQLHGDARRSPLALKPDNYSVSLGLAYRH